MASNAIPAGFRALPLSIAQLSLAAVLRCGQSFRWTSFPLSDTSPDCNAASPSHPTHEYRLCLRDRVVCLRQGPDTLFYRSFVQKRATSSSNDQENETETLEWLVDYFQLKVDLIKLYDEWSEKDPVFANVRSRFAGIRILRQDPWENLVSFICSSNNHIGRITKMVQLLCLHFSPALLSLPPPSSSTGVEQSVEQHPYHPFPPPSTLASPEVVATLRSLGFGYRAEFIQRTAKMLVDLHGRSRSSSDACEASEAWLRTLRDLKTEEARAELLKFVGVGRKVADCVLLMSLDKKEVIPVDTHVYQIAVKKYGAPARSKGVTPKVYDEVNSRLVGVWGEYAGWAHSVLFTTDLKSFSTYGTQNLTPVHSMPLKTSPSKKRKRIERIERSD